jgi:hypothetical protein
MVSTKEGKTKKLAPVSGVLSELTGSEFPNDFLTWHDLLPHRIWVHSRKSGGGYKPLAVELQWLGNKSTPISDEERSTRLKLAILRTGDVVDSLLGPSTFRGIPVGSVLEAHASLVLSQKLERLRKTDRPIELVKDHESETYQTFNLFFDGTRRIEKAADTDSEKEIGANLRDSLVVSYIYAEQCASGSKRPALLTAKLLNVKPSLVYVAVRIARRKGWLTESTSGTSGGYMTNEGLKQFAKINGTSVYQEFVNRGLLGVKK